MKRKNGKILLRLLCFALTFVLLGGISLHVSGSNRYFSGDAEVYYQSLIEAGFPEEYAVSLTELHLLHPSWRFEPLLVTEENPTYTWDHVLQEESKEPDNNLISSSNTYRDYHHPQNKELYDSGYYQVSKEGLAYFMDPRSFLNETDIFQFYLLSNASNASPDAIDAVLQGTFMESALLENGKSFSAYFLELGEYFGINPVYLAVRARQEQGVDGSSPLVLGACGSVLRDFYHDQTQSTEDGRPVLTPAEGFDADALQALDGLYNFFNVGASGDGLFSIYYNAVRRAELGTESMSSIWGSSAWNTLWKSIYGGADIIHTSYISRYQNTIYLQKFNVDPRAADRNFWGQYMQNVTAALTEARTLFSAFASIGALDTPATFLIPVYGQMPSDASPDPARGNCSYLASANRKYEYSVLCDFSALISSENAAVYTSQAVYPESELTLNLLVEHSYGIKALEYRWYGEEWKLLEEDSSASLLIPIDFSVGSSHILLIRGAAAYDHEDSAKKSNAYVLCAVIYIDVVEPPKKEITVDHGGESESYVLSLGSEFTLPVRKEQNFIGWMGSDGSFLPNEAVIKVSEDCTYTALFADFEQLEGASLVFLENRAHLRFYAAMENEALERLNALASDLSISCTIKQSGADPVISEVVPYQPMQALDAAWQSFCAVTEGITGENVADTYSASFDICFSYSDGSSFSRRAFGTASSRSASMVAAAALADSRAGYSADVIAGLEQIIALSEK